MKQWLRTLILFVLVLSLGACGTGAPEEADGQQDVPSEQVTSETGTAAIGATTDDQLAALISAAQEEGSLIWYESSPEEDATEIFAAFQEKYPFVTDLQHARLRGAEVTSRIAQESQAGATTADVGTSGGDTAWQLNQRDLLANVEWEKLGTPEQLVPEPFLVATTSAVYVILYNTDRVSEEQAPQNWEDLLDPQWKGQIGTWVQPFAFAELVPSWGEERTREFVEQFAAQEPVVYESSFPLAQAVGAGEIPVGVGIYHAAQPAIEQGAPIKVVIPDPTPLTVLYSFVTKAAPNPNTDQLFAAWLTSQEGALTYEKVTGRGNPLIPETETAQLLEGRTLTYFPPRETAELSRWLEEFSGFFQ